MSLTEEARQRGCYCGTWDTNPEAFESAGIPRGFCGFCQVCGRPGHTRHFPGAVPYTGCWCERHWWRIVWLDPRATIGCMVWLVGLALVGFGLWWWRHH
jgi:hypothetical protein